MAEDSAFTVRQNAGVGIQWNGSLFLLPHSCGFIPPTNTKQEVNYVYSVWKTEQR